MPYSTPVFYNKKKDGIFWPLFNYRKINTITVTDISPLPYIITILKDTVGTILFSKFDCIKVIIMLQLKKGPRTF